MKRYRCFKEVDAAKIVGISIEGGLTLEGGAYILMSREWLDKHAPSVGGYFVRYADGYESYSPAEAFESGYKQITGVSSVYEGLIHHKTFSAALEYLKQGRKMAREGWNGKGMYIEMQSPDEHSKMQQPYLFIVPGENCTVPWVASQVDLLADDWVIVE